MTNLEFVIPKDTYTYLYKQQYTFNYKYMYENVK